MLTLLNLDDETRRYMLEEIEMDMESETLFLSPRLSPTGVLNYPNLLKEAARLHDDDWLAMQLQRSGHLNDRELRRNKNTGVSTSVAVPRNAHDVLAEGEFNRFYIRALCRRAINDNIDTLVVYRARQSMNPRPESEAMIGTRMLPQSLLDDLRRNIGIETVLGLPTINSGLSAKLP